MEDHEYLDSLRGGSSHSASRDLVIRVLAGKGFNPEGKRSLKFAVTFRIGDIEHRTPFAESSHGKVAWQAQIVYRASELAPGLGSVDVSTLRSTRGSFARSKPGAITTINFEAFAESSSGDHAGWFPVGAEEVKLAIFWRPGSEEGSKEITSPSSDRADVKPGKSGPSLKNLLVSLSSRAPLVSWQSDSLTEKKVISKGDIIYAPDDDAISYGQPGARSHLSVAVLAARGLRAVNFGGKSDPFAVVAIHGTRKKNKPIKNTLEPKWSPEESTFIFGDIEDLTDDDELQVVIKDWDPFGQYKDLGQVVLTLQEISTIFAHDGEVWLTLGPTPSMSDRSRGMDLGSLLLRAKYVPKQASEQVPQQRPGSLTPTSPRRLTVSPSGASELTVVDKPKLYVRLIQARNLFPSDFGGVSDPYVVMKCRSERLRTPTRMKTLTPVYDFEVVFGERDYLQENDEFTITVYDQDSVISSIVDDELGTLSIPLWSIAGDAASMEAALAEPRWYSLEPSTTGQRCAGEVQLALFYHNPAASKADIYNGKVWLFELQATVVAAKNLATMSTDPNARIKPYCTVVCGNKDRWRTTIASNGITPTWSERFRFRTSADSRAEREGIQRTDSLRVTVFNSISGECLGFVHLDVAYIMDRLGYVDLQGKSLTSWFDLEPLHGFVDSEQSVKDGDGTDDVEDDATTVTFEGDNNSEVMSTDSSKKMGFASVFKRGIRLRQTRSGEAVTPSSPTTPFPSGPIPPSPVLSTISDATIDRPRHKGQIRLTIRLLPIGETRVKPKKKLAIYLDEFSASNAATSLPSLVYARCRVGFDVRQSPVAPLYRSPAGATSRLHASLGFEEEIDFLIQEGNRRRVLEEKRRRRNRYLGGVESNDVQDITKAQDLITVSIHDSSDDLVLAEFKTTFADSQLDIASQPRMLRLTGPAGSVQIQAKIVNVKEEMVPLLGHIYVRLLSFKSHSNPRFEHSLRFVIRYGDRAVASRAITGDPSPSLKDVFGYEVIRFPVYTAFKPVTVEIWQSRPSTDASEGRSARKLARTMLSMFRRSQSESSETADVPLGEDNPSSRWGKLIASATMTLFDIIEVEARSAFEDEGLTRRVPEEAFKLKVRERRSGDVVGSLWIQARYSENVGGLLSPNPNPAMPPSKPFSLANFRHEVNRLAKAAAWLSGFGAHVNSLLSWDSPVRTVSTIMIIFVVCTVDWFASRWLMVFPLCMLIHMVNRHRLRSNGMLLTEFEEADEDEAIASAEMRIACISAKPGEERVWRKVHAQVGLISRPGKSAKVIGTTRVDTRLEDGIADFAISKVGYSVRESTKARPSIHMWKYSETLPAVPSFTFRVDNFTVHRETILSVTVFSARNLVAADSNGLSDPFVKVYMKDASSGSIVGDTHRSMVRPKTLNPVWNERFILGEKHAVSSSNVLVLSFYDSDVMSTSHDALGTIEIELGQLSETFPVHSDATKLPTEERAILSCKWLPLNPPKGAASLYKGVTHFGEACLFVEWLSVDSKIPIPNQSLEDDEDVPPDSWTHCGAQIVVDLFDQRDKFLGRAQFPVGSVVANDGTRLQPQVELDLPLLPRFNGAHDDLKSDGSKAGSVVVRAMLTLPDPLAKERRMAMLEARRADRSTPLQKMRMITKHLARIQGQLLAVNARAERFKNLFNWTHPKRTKLMFNLFTFLFVLFTFIPSRFFILMVVLFFFTEKFRPMGTMGARFKHLLSQIPTDDELREVVKSNAVTGKRKNYRIFAGLRATSDMEASKDSNHQAAYSRVQTPSAREMLTSAGTSKKALNSLLSNICASDAVFNGSLAFCKVSASGDSLEGLSIRSNELIRRYFIVSSMGLHYWTDKDALEESKALGHLIGIKDVHDRALPQVLNCQRPENLFLVDCEGESYLFFASTAGKKRAWMTAIAEQFL